LNRVQRGSDGKRDYAAEQLLLCGAEANSDRYDDRDDWDNGSAWNHERRPRLVAAASQLERRCGAARIHDQFRERGGYGQSCE
jgi:hypothetical protein